MKLFIKNMVSLRCKMLVKSELEILGLHYTSVELGEVEIEVELRDIFARQKSKCVIHVPRSQAIFRAGRGYFDGVAEGKRWHQFRLPVNPDLRTKPIVSETPVRTARVSL